jgi:hypothetical protein
MEESMDAERKQHNFPIGARVHYAGAWGTKFSQPGTVTGRGEKNGRTVLDVHLDTGADHWGYLDQFTPM